MSQNKIFDLRIKIIFKTARKKEWNIFKDEE